MRILPAILLCFALSTNAQPRLDIRISKASDGPRWVGERSDGKLVAYLSNSDAAGELIVLDTRGRFLHALASPFDRPGLHASGRAEGPLLLADDSVLIAAEYRPEPNARAFERLLRVTAEGMIDEGFAAAFASMAATWGQDDHIRAIVQLEDGTILLGGTFNGMPLAALYPDGSENTAFSRNIAGLALPGIARWVVREFSGDVLAQLWVSDRNEPDQDSPGAIVRIKPDGTPGQPFHPPTLHIARPLPLRDGSCVVAPSIQWPIPDLPFRLARLRTDGSLDAAFRLPDDLAPGRFVQAIAAGPEGQLFVGLTTVGRFAYLGTKGTVLRLLSDGQADPGFTEDTEGRTIEQLIPSDDSKLLVLDHLNEYDSPFTWRLRRLTAAGEVDANFDPGAGQQGTRVRSVHVPATNLRPNASVQFQVSSDLRTWKTLESFNFVGSGTSADFSDLPPTNTSPRFFRVWQSR